MRLAFVSPMPPVKTGIADYSAALLSCLTDHAEIVEIASRPERFDPGAYDVILYQIGNNRHHGFVYEMALEHPGVVVLHEANLHHLIAELTIRRGDWDAYMREVERSGGAEALAHARRVRALETGPDYEGVDMLGALMERSRGLIVHSRYVAAAARRAGFAGPVAVIPHGVWVPEVNRWEYRKRLGLNADTPLAGTFGFLKPYKRIAESLRAFRRVVRAVPEARMILVGEMHPELPVENLIQTLGLASQVRVLGFTPEEDFPGFIAACDAVLNLRYPSAGESSGSLMRAMGLGRPCLVSDIAAFSELPDEVCLKTPVDDSEEDYLFEYLKLLLTRPDLGRHLGERAREWAVRECNWALSGARYASFLEAVVAGRPPSGVPAEGAPAAPPQEDATPSPRPAEKVTGEYILSWASSPAARAYAETHLARLERTLALTPLGRPEQAILEMGAYMQITPALKKRLGYGQVRGCYYGPAGQTSRHEIASATGDTFVCELDLFDAENDPFPYPDACFDTVLCCELIEHLARDPMHMMAEINRILKADGHLVLTTPNMASLRAIAAILNGYHPGFFPAYLRPAANGETGARHNREYTAKEIYLLLLDGGFEVLQLETGPFREAPQPEHVWVEEVLRRFQFSTDLRGDGVYAVGKKIGPVRERFPGWLYSGSS